ncbi:MAG TPA: hypothetical protein VFX92_03385 [Candidatus Krumholzibacteria bacterium]|nr:hypothetical protein [Candidatus Krumholzibacteria bacterium]
MTSRNFSDAARGRPLGISGNFLGGSHAVRLSLAAIAAVVAGLVTASVIRSQRVAVWAPLDVVSTRDPLQELPIRIAGDDGVVRPAHTYDAVLDMSRLSSLVIGVDLDVIPKGSAHYDAVIRDPAGTEVFRDGIDGAYFADGRFMLRLFSRRFHAGDYLLEIEASDASGNSQVVAASWFQVIP